MWQYDGSKLRSIDRWIDASCSAAADVFGQSIGRSNSVCADETSAEPSVKNVKLKSSNKVRKLLTRKRKERQTAPGSPALVLVGGFSLSDLNQPQSENRLSWV